jgi:outer membrane protein OmpA-like peptidoglycan-associated protein
MRAALLISGYLRNYEINIKNLKEKLFTKFEVVDTFLHITKNENQEDKYLNLIDEKEDIQNITKLLNPISTLIEDNVSFHTNKQINDIINQWGKLYKLNQLKKIYEKCVNRNYDLVIRYRPDVFLENYFEMSDLSSLKKIIIPSESKIDKSKLLNPKDDYICDAFAIGSSTEMDKYFDIFENIHELISNYGFVSETFLKKYLDNNFIDYELKDIKYSFILSKCNVFAICGDSGSGKSTLSKILKNIFFDSKKAELKPESTIELNKVIQLLKDNPQLKILITGHTDNVGKAADNLILSNSRAEAVIHYILSTRLFSKDRLQYKGMGSTQPIANNETETGKASNRRTEMTIISNSPNP